jgi:hypothetical protein
MCGKGASDTNHTSFFWLDRPSDLARRSDKDIIVPSNGVKVLTRGGGGRKRSGQKKRLAARGLV